MNSRLGINVCISHLYHSCAGKNKTSSILDKLASDINNPIVHTILIHDHTHHSRHPHHDPYFLYSPYSHCLQSQGDVYLTFLWGNRPLPEQIDRPNARGSKKWRIVPLGHFSIAGSLHCLYKTRVGETKSGKVGTTTTNHTLLPHRTLHHVVCINTRSVFGGSLEQEYNRNRVGTVCRRRLWTAQLV